MEFLANTDGTLGTLQTVRWPCEPTFLCIEDFKVPIEV